MNKTRLTALDGLRGFAALAVTISHVGFNLRLIIDNPVTNYLFRIISAGPTSVQLFFVLSGFLMSYLYPSVKNTLSFLEKRYLRIMPVFGVVVLGLWLSYVYPRFTTPMGGLVGITLVASITSLSWIALRKLHQKIPRLGHAIFFLFLAFQAVFVVISLSTALGVGTQFIAHFNAYQKYLFVMLSNLSMTMYLQKELFILEGVFWSLVPEMFFYTIYPFLVAPLIALSGKLSKKWNVVMFLSVIIFLFQLDMGSRAVYSLHGLFFSRSTGFLLGITLGSLYRSQGKIWNMFASVIQKPWASLSVFLLFFFTMALEWPDRFHQIRQYVMLHYLLLSILFTLVVGSALVERSLVQRFFSKRIFVYFGSISYSLYLIHPFMMAKIAGFEVWKTLLTALSPQMYAVVQLVVWVGASILGAVVLHTLVESLYFKKGKKAVKQMPAKKPVLEKKISLFSPKQFIFAPLIAVVVIIAYYSTDAVPSLFLARHSLNAPALFSELHVMRDNPVSFSFQADRNNLSVVSLAMDYAADPNKLRTEENANPQLVFELKDQQGNLIVRSVRSPGELGGAPQFPFGLPTQQNSEGKTYTAQLHLEHASDDDEIYLYPGSGAITQYTTEGRINAQILFTLAFQRILFSLRYFPTLFAIGAIGASAIAYHKTRVWERA